VLRDDGVDRPRVREDGHDPPADRDAASAHRAVERLPLQGREGKPELAEDERFASHHARGENEDLLDEIIGEWAGRHTAEELDRIVNEAGVVCAPVYDAKDIYEDPYFRERELLVEYEDEVHGRISAQGIVPKLTGTPGRVRQPARWTVGADTDDVMSELGVEGEELDALREAGVV
jgi:crotonobetainyl-CoA:carnitine CoA-transferase CaiB-like acyl-CoA transferase